MPCAASNPTRTKGVRILRTAKIIQRILATVPIVLGVVILVFVFMRFIPGDPVDLMMGQSGNVSRQEIADLRAQFNLDAPVYVQLYDYLGKAVQGNLGESYMEKRPVIDLIGQALPATLELSLMAILFALIVAIPIGVYSAVKQNSILDRASMGISFLGVSMPGFWLGILLMLIFSVKLGIAPTQGRIAYGTGLVKVTGFYVFDSILTGNWAALRSSLAHLILPAITLGSPTAAVVARVVRSSMLEVMRQDYIVLARAKGLREFRVVVRHALRNALIPTVTVLGTEVGALLGGNMIVETVFGWPGLGRLAVTAIFNRDYPLVQGVVMFYALVFVMANLGVDILYTYLNPKISL
ncbi:Binding-protein-dependent transport system inner membrane component [Acididesulfobacillus acetoxydans]|uniref:Binding-protein-dependent transport system inner membrane component n=1 Tax=Acididesulfobacillus acetoxydans TaxID=1561005 RepID=A0A8S0WAE1_9FIRM|nr:Binding-protein-dependent transport system inner membrane component [Acididesulfobacillus acetoxydans]